MTNIKRFCYNYPILTSMVVPIIYLIIIRQCIMGIAISLFFLYSGNAYGAFSSLIVGEIVTIIADLLVLYFCGNIRILVQRGISFKRKVLYSSYMILEILVLFAINVHQIFYYGDTARSPHMILECIVYLFLASASEEFIYRGFLAEILASKYLERRAGIWIVVIVSSIAFSSIHLWNFLIPGASIIGITAQILNAFLIGAYFAVIFLWTKSIWVSVVLHFLYNFSQLLRDICFIGREVAEVISGYGETFNYKFFCIYIAISVLVIGIMISIMEKQRGFVEKEEKAKLHMKNK